MGSFGSAATTCEASFRTAQFLVWTVDVSTHLCTAVNTAPPSHKVFVLEPLLILLQCAGPNGGSSSLASAGGDDVSTLMNTALLADRNKAFELFRKSYRQNEVRDLGCDVRTRAALADTPTFSHDRAWGWKTRLHDCKGGIKPSIAQEGKGG